MTRAMQMGKRAKPQGVTPSVVLCNPKYARNVAMAIRTALCFGIEQVWYTGNRVSVEEPWRNLDFPGGPQGKPPKARLPREERMKGYESVMLVQNDYPFDQFPRGTVPVAVELRPQAEMLNRFVHPENAVYVFGPEDGSIPKAVVRHCHRFVVIPTRHCLNLAMAVAVVLYSRYDQRTVDGLEDDLPMSEILQEDRGWT